MSDWSTPAGFGSVPTEATGLAQALRVLLLLSALLSAGLALLAVRMRAALDDVDQGALLVGASAKGEVDAFFGGAGVYFLAVAGIGILFVVWLWRAARTNQGFGRPGALGPGWAIGSWFIPLGSLVIPGIIVQQLWRGADATVPRGDPAWRRVAADGRIWLWWLAYVAGQTLTFAGFSLVGQTDDPEGEISVASLLDHLDETHLGVTLFVAGQVFLIGAAVLGASVVVRLSRRQAEAAAGLGTADPFEPVRSPPGWHRDPTGRNDLRYWDGQLWTEHVTRGDSQSVDPV